METEKTEVNFKVAEKTRTVSVYIGRRRFPVSLYYSEWTAILDAADALRTFLEENRAQGKLALRNGE